MLPSGNIILFQPLFPQENLFLSELFKNLSHFGPRGLDRQDFCPKLETEEHPRIDDFSLLTFLG